jgi:predicted transcriptional regulator
MHRNCDTNGHAMKNATLPPLRVDSELRAAAESVLQNDETLSAFVLEAVRLNIERRERQREFIKRGLQAREQTKKSGLYVSSEQMLKRLDESLAKARARQPVRNR